MVGLVAIASNAGESTSNLLKNYPTTPGFAHVKATDGYLTLDEQGFVEDFMQDGPTERARVAAKTNRRCSPRS